jgi:crotonobetainyl-CoA:carnitine CoA-transferase CaiB-like acyl-CoA transferase
MVRDPQGKPVDLVGTPFTITGVELPGPTMPPTLGEHTDEVLRDLIGVSPEEVCQLRERGVI